MMNVIPSKTLQSFRKIEYDIISSDLMVIIVTGEASKRLGVIPLQITVRSKISVTTFMINSTAIYNLLLGKD